MSEAPSSSSGPSSSGAAPPGASPSTVGGALAFIGCAALLGIAAAIIVRGGGRALAVLAALVAALLLVVGVLRARQRGAAARRFRERYGPEGKDLLLVYTASPRWQEYIEREWIPRWRERAVILNRTKPWNANDPAAQLWLATRGIREHTPLAAVVPARGPVRVVRFFNAFRDYKHGKDARLRAAERALEAALAEASRQR